MAFTGVAVVKQISDSLVRITGLSLASATSGTISLATGSGADVALPSAFKPRPYRGVSLQDALEVRVVCAGAQGQGLAIPVMVNKTGTTPADFLLTLQNTALSQEGGGNDTAALEIYVRFH